MTFKEYADTQNWYRAPKEIYCWNNGITDLKGISDPKYKDIETLECFSNFITDMDEVSACKNLKTIHCGSNKLTDIKFVSKLPNLKCLSINNNPITGLDGIQYCKYLTGLNINDCKISSLYLLKGLPLTEIYFENNNFKISEEWKILKNLPLKHYLKEKFKNKIFEERIEMLTQNI